MSLYVFTGPKGKFLFSEKKILAKTWAWFSLSLSVSEISAGVEVTLQLPFPGQGESFWEA